MTPIKTGIIAKLAIDFDNGSREHRTIKFVVAPDREPWVIENAAKLRGYEETITGGGRFPMRSVRTPPPKVYHAKSVNVVWWDYAE